MRLRAGTLAALSLVAVAACGGSAQPQAEERPLPRALASDLADKSEAIAAALDAGDQCGAAHLADELQDAVEAAVADGRIPAEFQGELEEAALDLQNGVNCVVEEEDPGTTETKDKGKDEGKGKKKGHEDDSVTIETTEEDED